MFIAMDMVCRGHRRGARWALVSDGAGYRRARARWIEQPFRPLSSTGQIHGGGKVPAKVLVCGCGLWRVLPLRRRQSGCDTLCVLSAPRGGRAGSIPMGAAIRLFGFRRRRCRDGWRPRAAFCGPLVPRNSARGQWPKFRGLAPRWNILIPGPDPNPPRGPSFCGRALDYGCGGWKPGFPSDWSCFLGGREGAGKLLASWGTVIGEERIGFTRGKNGFVFGRFGFPVF